MPLRLGGACWTLAGEEALKRATRVLEVVSDYPRTRRRWVGGLPVGSPAAGRGDKEGRNNLTEPWAQPYRGQKQGRKQGAGEGPRVQLWKAARTFPDARVYKSQPPGLLVR